MIDLETDQLHIIKNILDTHFPDAEVRVFGSRITGKSKRYSDLDLALVGKDKLDEKRLDTLKDALSSSELPIQVDVVDWLSLSNSFRKAISEKYEVL